MSPDARDRFPEKSLFSRDPAQSHEIRPPGYLYNHCYNHPPEGCHHPARPEPRRPLPVTCSIELEEEFVAADGDLLGVIDDRRIHHAHRRTLLKQP